MKLNIYLLIALIFFAGLHQAAAQSFVLSSSPPATTPISILAADVNGDGKKDLVCVISSVFNTPSKLSIFTNNGSGGFILSSKPQVGVHPNSVVAADLNEDGQVDLICANASIPGTLTVLTNSGGGRFGSYGTLNVNSSPNSVVALDVNGDNKVDLIYAYNDASGNTLSVLTNDGSGGFVFASTPDPGIFNYPVSIYTADINDDGKVDFITANRFANTLSVLTNKGSGLFGLKASIPVTSNPVWVTTADVNGDGWVDLISAHENASGTLTVLTNNRTGSFGSNATLNVGGNPSCVIAADVNGDGNVDLICANSGVSPSFSGTLSVLTNNGSGSFALATTLSAGGGAQSVVAADINGDGRLDLASANYFGSTLSVLTNSLTFLPRLTLKNSTNSVTVSWPSQWTGWAGWSLQQNTNLNTTNWTSFSGTIGDDGAIKTVTNTSLSGNLFFRLSHP